MFRSTTLLGLLVLLLGCAVTASAQNCCMPDMGDDPQSASLIGGIYSATALMLAVPPVLIGAVSFWMVHRWRTTPLDNGDDKSDRSACG